MGYVYEGPIPVLSEAHHTCSLWVCSEEQLEERKAHSYANVRWFGSSIDINLLINKCTIHFLSLMYPF